MAFLAQYGSEIRAPAASLAVKPAYMTYVKHVVLRFLPTPANVNFNADGALGQGISFTMNFCKFRILWLFLKKHTRCVTNVFV